MRPKLVADVKTFKSGTIRMTAELNRVLPGIARDMLEDMKQVILDEPPSCPVDTGYMYDHHYFKINWRKKSIVGASVGVKDTPYAASLHEGISRWGTPYKNFTRPGSGPKWIESKLIRHKTRFGVKMKQRLDRRIK